MLLPAVLAVSAAVSSAQSATRHADDGLALAYSQSVADCTTDQIWCGTYLRHSVGRTPCESGSPTSIPTWLPGMALRGRL